MEKGTLPNYNIDKFKHLGKEQDFYANKFSDHLKQHGFISNPHRHDFFLVALCTRGSGTHWVDFIQYDVKPGTIFMLSPGQGHTWVLSDDIDGYVFFHTRDFFELNFSFRKLQDYPFYCSIYNSPTIMLSNNSLQKECAIFEEIIQEYRNQYLMKFSRIFVLVELLYIDLVRLYLPIEQIDKQNQNYLNKLQILEDLIDTNFKILKSPGQYAEMMFVSVKQLNRICKECLDKSTSDLIIDRVMLEAKRMLIYSTCSISQIAEQIGYTDISYFSRLFKKKSGKTPAEFIKVFGGPR